MYKIVFVDKNALNGDEITLSKKDFEDLLDNVYEEAYGEGWEDGYNSKQCDSCTIKADPWVTTYPNDGPEDYKTNTCKILINGTETLPY